MPFWLLLHAYEVSAQNSNAMNSSSKIGALIIEAGASGNLVKLNEIKERVGDGREFGRLCDAINDFCTGRRVLHLAAELGHFPICKFLIHNVGVHIDVLTDTGDTPLMLAAKEERVKIVKYLIKKGALVRMSNSKGFTSLHYAVLKDNRELMELLLRNDAPIDAESVDGTPLQCAASHGSVETVKFLLDHGAEPNSISAVCGSPLICAIKSHSFECMELLLKAGADPNKSLYGLNSLAHGAKEGDAKFLKPLLEAGADPNSPSTALLKSIEHAALARNLEGVRILFPQTQRIPYYPNWSVDGIMEHFHSEEAKTKREENRRSYLNVMDEAGKSAVSREDYFSAITCYTEAILVDPSNPKWVSNRSLCFAPVGRGVHALRDAQEFVRLDPKCAKAHYREGAAWKLFQNYHMAALAFKEASILAPHNKEIGDAYRVALFEYWSFLNLCCPKEMMTHFQHFL